MIYLAIFLATIIAIAILVWLFRKKSYEKTAYFAATRTPYRVLWRDKGLLGEYMTFRYLRKLSGYKKFLFNCYIPKEDGTLTEIDLILLHKSGVYVFESKNYGGWIFGNEASRNWTQTFRNGHKERFLNPIKQNENHIKHLLCFLPGLPAQAVHSVIVFSERCELRKITLTTGRHIVIKRNEVLRTVSRRAKTNILSQANIDAIYQRLYPQTQLSAQAKEAHRQRVANITAERRRPS